MGKGKLMFIRTKQEQINNYVKKTLSISLVPIFRSGDFFKKSSRVNKNAIFYSFNEKSK